MSIAFAAEVIQDGESLVETVFSRPVALRNESIGEAKVPAGRIALIANYRGFKQTGKGRSARGAGGAVLDLSAFSRLPASELPDLIEKLEALQSSLPDGIRAAEALQG